MPPAASVASPALSASASAAVDSFVDATSSSPEALAEYRQGVQGGRDMVRTMALKHLARAEQLDPDLGAAYLREITHGGRGNAVFRFSSIRESFQLAFQHRASLTPPQRELLDAVEPWAREPPALAEADRALVELGKRYPRDVDVPLLLSTVRGIRFDAPGMKLAADDAIRIAPDVAAVWGARARALVFVDDFHGAIAAEEQCLRISPAATGCLSNMARQYDALGECAEAEEASKRLVATDPTLSAAYESRALYLYAAGKPIEAVRSAYDRYLSGLSAAERPAIETSVALIFDLARGDFAAAIAKLPVWEQRLREDPDMARHGFLANTRMELALETGQPAEAIRAADDFFARRDGWVNSAASQEDTSISLLWLKQRAGGDVRAARDAWVAAERTRAARTGVSHDASEGTTWIKGYAAFARNAEEAREALSLMPEAGLPAVWRRDDFAVGEVFLLAGRIDEAVSHLRMRSRFCDRLQHLINTTWARDAYAQALEAKGDTAGACTEYGTVLDLWGHATPRSVTADHARARTKALGCSK